MGSEAVENVQTDSQGAVPGWKKAQAVLHLVQASKGFKTLRDMVPDESIITQDRLTVKSQLGEGAFAYVNLALLDKQRQVAIKTLKPELLESPSDVQLFLKETELMRKIRHAAVVELVGVGGKTDPNSGAFLDLFIVQEYCAGGSLKDLVFKQMITTHKTLYSQADALRWSLHTAKALRYIHAAKPKIIHRDLKLDNILLSDKRPGAATAKLADFGLAKLMNKSKQVQEVTKELAKLVSVNEAKWTALQKQKSRNVASALSRIASNVDTSKTFTPLELSTATTCFEMTGEAGSYGYMAPEVLSGTDYDEKADIFSFAMVMYNMFYRVIPSVLIVANGGDPEDVAMLAYQTANGYRPTLGNAVPEEVNTLINECWSGIPELRPSADEIVKRLEAIEAMAVCKGSGVAVKDGGGDGAKAGCSCSVM